MSITKLIRFEVFKRDGFQCAYCGRTPPAVTLEVDHINPRSSGGNDDINNLITACFDCNRGKRSVPLDKVPLKMKDNIEALKEQALQLEEFKKYTKQIEQLLQEDINEICQLYTSYYPGWQFSDHFINQTLKRFVRQLPKDEIIDVLGIAARNVPDDKDRAIRYFCGICWRKIKGTARYK